VRLALVATGDAEAKPQVLSSFTDAPWFLAMVSGYPDRAVRARLAADVREQEDARSGRRA